MLKNFLAAVTLSLSFAFPLFAQEQVHIGIYVNDLPKVDLVTNSFTVDAFIWFRWNDSDFNPAKTLEFMNPYEGWDGNLTPVFEAPERLDDGSLYASARYQGQFSSSMPLTQYPFDSQRLLLRMEDSNANVDELVFVPDEDAVTINPSVSLSDYRFGTPTMTVTNETYATRFGDTTLDGPETYSRATVAIPLFRPSVTYGIKVIFPIFIILACAGLALWLHPGHSEARVGLVVTALLTLVALQLTALPQVNYLIMMDWIFLIAYLYVLATLAQVVRSHWVVRSRDEDSAVGMDRRAFAVLTGSFLVLFGLIHWVSLSA